MSDVPQELTHPLHGAQYYEQPLLLQCDHVVRGLGRAVRDSNRTDSGQAVRGLDQALGQAARGHGAVRDLGRGALHQ